MSMCVCMEVIIAIVSLHNLSNSTYYNYNNYYKKRRKRFNGQHARTICCDHHVPKKRKRKKTIKKIYKYREEDNTTPDYSMGRYFDVFSFFYCILEDVRRWRETGNEGVEKTECSRSSWSESGFEEFA